MYKLLLKPLFFLLSPERAHYFTLFLFRIALAIPMVGYLIRRYYAVNNKSLEREVFGLKFANPIGLAAGFDKNGKYFHTMAALGFGHIEVGTVTPRPQSGNPKPRLFRLPQAEALINRMGFNNNGVEALIKQLQKKRPKGLIIGGNIGKNKDTPNEQAVDDYVYCFEKLFPYVDYFVVNVSSPNTPGLRALQEKEPLTHILNTLQSINPPPASNKMPDARYQIPSNFEPPSKPKPILLKIAPDLTDEQLDDIVEIVETTRIAGIIATNTTISRENLIENVEAMGAGGLSGKPLRARSTAIIQYLKNKSNGQLIIIGVGGVAAAADAIEKLEAGASLVQLYTGLIYEGPMIVKRINQGLLK